MPSTPWRTCCRRAGSTPPPRRRSTASSPSLARRNARLSCSGSSIRSSQSAILRERARSSKKRARRRRTTTCSGTVWYPCTKSKEPGTPSLSYTARAPTTEDKADKLSHLRAAADLFIHRSRTPDSAIPLLEEASVLDPEDRTTKVALADAFVNASRFTEARSLLRSIVDGFGGRRPRERGIVHYHLALLEIAMDNRAQALVELEAATKIDPGNAQILRALAELARADGQIDRAVRWYRALLVPYELGPEESTDDASVVRSEVLLELSAIAAGQGETNRAHELIESALESASKSAVESRRLEQGLRDKKDFPTLVRALEARLERATTDAERVEALTELARVLDVELGHVAAAFAARQKVLALTPASVEAHEASLALARRVDGVTRYLEDVEELAATAEREGRRAAASALYLRSARTIRASSPTTPGRSPPTSEASRLRCPTRPLETHRDSVPSRRRRLPPSARLIPSMRGSARTTSAHGS